LIAIAAADPAPADVKWILMVPLRYGQDILQYVAVLELEDSSIKGATGYWGSPFTAPEARVPFNDRG
jgi:hypothetical protein